MAMSVRKGRRGWRGEEGTGREELESRRRDDADCAAAAGAGLYSLAPAVFSSDFPSLVAIAPTIVPRGVGGSGLGARPQTI